MLFKKNKKKDKCQEGIKPVQTDEIGNYTVETDDSVDKNTVGETEYTVDKKDEDRVLYIVIDKEIPGLIDYFRSIGINVSYIYNRISKARDSILMQPLSCRIIVIDTGMGIFTTTKVRHELIDMLGICDEDNKVTVFYTDSVLKDDTVKELGKNKSDLDWYKYIKTADVANYILGLGENYILDDHEDTGVYDSVNNEELLEFRGDEVSCNDSDGTYDSLTDVSDILQHINTEADGQLKAYKVV